MLKRYFMRKRRLVEEENEVENEDDSLVMRWYVADYSTNCEEYPVIELAIITTMQ